MANLKLSRAIKQDHSKAHEYFLLNPMESNKLEPSPLVLHISILLDESCTVSRTKTGSKRIRNDEMTMMFTTRLRPPFHSVIMSKFIFLNRDFENYIDYYKV